MNKAERELFRNFLKARNIYQMFNTNYRNSRLAINPPTVEGFLDTVKAENAIPGSFVYPKGLYGRDFWLAINEEWLEELNAEKEEKRKEDCLADLGLEVVEMKENRGNFGLPAGKCSLNLRNGNKLTLNIEDSKRVAKKLSTKMLLTRSRQTMDVVLMFNRQKGLDVRFRITRGGGTSSLQFNNVELAERLTELLGLDTEKNDYFLLDIELLTETKDFLLFLVRK